jgi:hypothetical protein
VVCSQAIYRGPCSTAGELAERVKSEYTGRAVVYSVELQLK